MKALGLGMPVPPGFVVTTEACARYYEDERTIAPEIQEEILASLAQLEQITGKNKEHTTPRPSSKEFLKAGSSKRLMDFLSWGISLQRLEIPLGFSRRARL